MHFLKDFLKFIKYATYSRAVLYLPILPALAFFTVLLVNLKFITLICVYLAFFVTYYLVHIFVGYFVFRHMRNIGYFQAMNTYSDRPLIWLDVSFRNFLELRGIIFRKIFNRKTIKSPNITPYAEFFNIEGLSIPAKLAKISKYRKYVESRKALYPTVQWRLFQVQEFLAHHYIEQELNNIKNQQTITQVWRAVLGLKVDCSFLDAKRAYQKLAMKLHPDKGGNTLQFQQLNNSWQAAKKYFGQTG